MSSFEEVSSDSRESFLRYDFTLLRSKLIVFTTLISHLYGVWLPSALKRYPIPPFEMTVSLERRATILLKTDMISCLLVLSEVSASMSISRSDFAFSIIKESFLFSSKRYMRKSESIVTLPSRLKSENL